MKQEEQPRPWTGWRPVVAAESGKPSAGLSKAWRIALAGVAVVLVLLAGSAAYLHRLKPPGCNDPVTLMLAGYELAQLLGPAPIPELVQTKTLLGGRFAIRYVCSAEFANPPMVRLPDGVAMGSIRYTSALRGPDRTPEVSVKLVPVLPFLPWQ